MRRNNLRLIVAASGSTSLWGRGGGVKFDVNSRLPVCPGGTYLVTLVKGEGTGNILKKNLSKQLPLLIAATRGV